MPELTEIIKSDVDESIQIQDPSTVRIPPTPRLAPVDLQLKNMFHISTLPQDINRMPSDKLQIIDTYLDIILGQNKYGHERNANSRVPAR